ncbi:unnamed protein product, partial [Meganyctiphanes norvegica]
VSVGASVVILVSIIFAVNILQSKKPLWLPNILRSWDWLPLPLRSLEPYDKIMMCLDCCNCCSKLDKVIEEVQDFKPISIIGRVYFEKNTDQGTPKKIQTTQVDDKL